MSEHHRRGALDAVRHLSDDLAKAETERQRAIARALHHGASWSQVAQSLGVSTQAAHRRYRRLHYDPASGRAWQEPPLDIK